MRIKLSAAAEQHLQTGYQFYERQAPGLGGYFLDSLMADIESLHIHAGVHAVLFGEYYRLLAKRFPYSVYYRIDGESILIYAILDNRREPRRNRRYLTTRAKGQPKKPTQE